MMEKWGFCYDGSSSWSIGPASDPQTGEIFLHQRDGGRAQRLCEAIVAALNAAQVEPGQANV